MTGSEGVVSGLQQREPRDAASTALLFTDHQPVGMETPARVQVEVEHLGGVGTAEKKRVGMENRKTRVGEKHEGKEKTKKTGAFRKDVQGIKKQQRKFGEQRRGSGTDLQSESSKEERNEENNKQFKD